MKKFNYLFLAIFSISFCLASSSKTPEINDPSINEDENKNDNEDNNDETSNENASEISLDTETMILMNFLHQKATSH